MPRPTKPIDQIGMQKIVDDIKPDQFSNAMALCTHVANRYNSEIFPHNQSAQVDHQLVKLRINAGVIKLTFPLPVGRRGRQKGATITNEQKEKMQAGRKTKNISLPVLNDWASQTREKWSGTVFERTAELAIKGSNRAKRKLCCVECFGGDQPGVREDIRNCTSFACIWYPDRPFQKKEE